MTSIFRGLTRAHTRTAAGMLEPAAAAADRRRSRLASLPPRLRMSRMPPAPAELQDVDPKTARTRATRTRRAPAEQQSRRVRQCEHVAISGQAVCMGHGIRVTCGMDPFLERPYLPYFRTRIADLHAVIGGLERLCTQAEVRQVRRYGTCEGRFEGFYAAPFEDGSSPWVFASSR